MNLLRKRQPSTVQGQDGCLNSTRIWPGYQNHIWDQRKRVDFEDIGLVQDYRSYQGHLLSSKYQFWLHYVYSQPLNYNFLVLAMDHPFCQSNT